MGISIGQWRLRVGCFCQHGQSEQRGQSGQTGQIKERTRKGSHNMPVFVMALAALILLQCGDVESNPGPGPSWLCCVSAENAEEVELNKSVKSRVTNELQVRNASNMSVRDTDDKEEDEGEQSQSIRRKYGKVSQARTEGDTKMRVLQQTTGGNHIQERGQ